VFDLDSPGDICPSCGPVIGVQASVSTLKSESPSVNGIQRAETGKVFQGEFKADALRLGAA
jgi:hypothetical protein